MLSEIIRQTHHWPWVSKAGLRKHAWNARLSIHTLISPLVLLPLRGTNHCCSGFLKKIPPLTRLYSEIVGNSQHLRATKEN